MADLYIRQRVNIAMLTRVVGWLLMIEAAFMAIPILTSLWYHERDWLGFTISFGITFVSGFAMTTLVRPKRTSMGKREGFLLTAITWVIFSLFGTLPFIFGEHEISLTDAYFDSMSSFTTTGATTIDGIEHIGQGLLMWRSVMQWIGGLGIILFTLAVIPMLNQQGGMQMFNAEVTGITHEKIRPRVSQTAKGLWMVYILLTSTLFLLLWLGPMTGFDSLCHAMSVMSTGGISTCEASIERWNTPYVKILMTVFMFIGGVNFSLIYRMGTGSFRDAWRNQILKIFSIVVVVATVIVSILVSLNPGVPKTFESIIIDPLFQVVSMVTSTGYTLDVLNSWGPVVFLIMMLLMLSGGCAGSTSGGAKIDRFIVLFQHCRNEIQRCLHPNAILSVRTNGKVVPRDVVTKTIVFLCLFVIIILAGTILLTAMGLGITHSFMLALISITNSGITVPTVAVDTGFINIPDAGKWLLSFIMLVGRLEIFTVLLIFARNFWRR